ncbi:hypothetical protein F4810DRAFT_713821 [Camillea tinctor]|nr:hypothetical protein F4810DRAFT_713821 [Camillea tinctor]
MPKPKWMAKGGMGKRAKAAALAITAPATPKLSWKVKKENMQYEYEPQGGSNIDMLKMRRAAKGAGPIEDKTREFIMGVCSAMGRYEDVMGRIFTNFRKYYRTPKVAFTESRIAQVASETRSMQRCQVLAQKYHAHRVLSVCLKQLSSEGAWQTLQKPRGQESLGLTVRRFKFEPLLRDETSCFIYLLNTIDTVLRINSEREFEVLPQDVVANPAKIAKMLQLARKRAMSAAVLNAELCVDRIERHMVLNRADWARKAIEVYQLHKFRIQTRLIPTLRLHFHIGGFK